jgi:hemolysin III
MTNPSASANNNHSNYSNTEERLNCFSHAIGFLLALLGTYFLIVKADSLIAEISVLIYGCSLSLLLLASTLYHGVKSHSHKQKLKLVDHLAIYLLIAGTYTPFMLVALSGWLSIVGISLIWLIALGGILFKLRWGNEYPKISVSFYLIMGWLIIAFIKPLTAVIDANALWLLLGGGLFYSVGVIFYMMKNTAFTHAIWHCFVLAGCACHFFSIYVYVV